MSSLCSQHSELIVGSTFIPARSSPPAKTTINCQEYESVIFTLLGYRIRSLGDAIAQGQTHGRERRETLLAEYKPSCEICKRLVWEHGVDHGSRPQRTFLLGNTSISIRFPLVQDRPQAHLPCR